MGGSSRGGERYGGNTVSNSSANDQVIPAGGGRVAEKPKTLLTAISNIQQYYVIEHTGQDIPAEFLTIEGVIEFFKIGATGGFKEGLLLFLVYPLMEFYFIPFVLQNPDATILFIFNSIPYFMILFNTLLCLYISKFYVGQITRRAINSLFCGRAISLFTKGCLIFLLYYFISKLGTPENVWKLAQHFGKNAEKFYYGYFHIQPEIIPKGFKAFLLTGIASFGPYIFVYAHDWYRRYRIAKNMARVRGHM